MWTESYKGDTGNLSLLLEWARGRQRKNPSTRLDSVEHGSQHIDGMQTGSWALRLHFVKYSSNPLWRWVFLLALSVLSPAWIALVSVHVPIYNCFFFYYIVESQIYCKFSSRTQKLSKYHNKASNTIFLFPSAYKSYVYTTVYEEQ